jgi:osmotically-inducible protein OsmY
MARAVLVLALAAGVWAQTAAPKRAFSAADDKALEAEIRARLSRSQIASEGFTVRVQGGVAYWDGETAVAQRKGAATRMAKSAGAIRVENRIRVTPAGKRKLAGDFAGKSKSKESPPAAAPAPPRRVQVQWRPRSERR